MPGQAGLARIVAGDIERPFARPVSRLRAGWLLGLAKFFRKKKSEEAARDGPPLQIKKGSIGGDEEVTFQFTKDISSHLVCR